jgi:hypothetical protein
MRRNDLFVAGGSVMGTYHRKCFRNNQDAYCIGENDKALIAVVCDGCGSGKYSEVGSRLLSRFLVHEGLRLLGDCSGSIEQVLEQLRQRAVDFITRIAVNLGDDLKENINDHFLCTVFLAIVYNDELYIFTLGDGCFSVNGNLKIIDENNVPNYLAYGVLGSDDENYEFKFQLRLPMTEVKSVLLATDGAVEIEERAESMINILGSNQKIGHLSDFETDDRFLKNRSLLQKRLVILGVNHGIMSDDTTMVLIRRMEAGHDLDDQ